jgi:hypothetical protein
MSESKEEAKIEKEQQIDIVEPTTLLIDPGKNGRVRIIITKCTTIKKVDEIKKYALVKDQYSFWGE